MSLELKKKEKVFWLGGFAPGGKRVVGIGENGMEAFLLNEQGSFLDGALREEIDGVYWIVGLVGINDCVRL